MPYTKSGVRSNSVGSDPPCCNHETKLPLPVHGGRTLKRVFLQDSTKTHHLILPILLQNTRADHRESILPVQKPLKTLLLILYEGPETNISLWEMTQEEHVRKQSNKQHIRWI